MLLALALYQFRGIIAPVTIALIIAYVLTPVVDALERRSASRGLNVLLVDLLALALVAVIPALVAPTLIEQARQLDVDFEALTEDVIGSVAETLEAVVGSSIDVEELLEQTQVSIQGLLQPLLSQSVFFLLDLATGIFWAVFVFVVSFYLMRDWHRVTAYFRSVVPPGYGRDYAGLTAELKRIWQAFFRGQVPEFWSSPPRWPSPWRWSGSRMPCCWDCWTGLLRWCPTWGRWWLPSPPWPWRSYKGPRGSLCRHCGSRCW